MLTLTLTGLALIRESSMSDILRSSVSVLTTRDFHILTFKNPCTWNSILKYWVQNQRIALVPASLSFSWRTFGGQVLTGADNPGSWVSLLDGGHLADTWRTRGQLLDTSFTFVPVWNWCSSFENTHRRTSQGDWGLVLGKISFSGIKGEIRVWQGLPYFPKYAYISFENSQEICQEL